LFDDAVYPAGVLSEFTFGSTFPDFLGLLKFYAFCKISYSPALPIVDDGPIPLKLFGLGPVVILFMSRPFSWLTSLNLPSVFEMVFLNYGTESEAYLFDPF
jgi:hypothetical protein